MVDGEAFVADGDFGEGGGVVADELGGEDVGGEAGVVAGGNDFLIADEAVGIEGAFWQLFVVAQDGGQDGALKGNFANEHQGHVHHLLEGDGFAGVEGAVFADEQADVVFHERDGVGIGLIKVLFGAWKDKDVAVRVGGVVFKVGVAFVELDGDVGIAR